MRLPRGRNSRPGRPQAVPCDAPPQTWVVPIFSGAGNVLGPRPSFSHLCGLFALPIRRAPVGPEGGKPPGDTPALFRLGGPLQPSNCGGECHSRRLTRRELETHATQPNDAVNFSNATRYATHGHHPFYSGLPLQERASARFQLNAICRTGQNALRVRNTHSQKRKGPTRTENQSGPVEPLPASLFALRSGLGFNIRARLCRRYGTRGGQNDIPGQLA